MATKWGIASAGLICHDLANVITSLLPTDEHKIVAIAARHQKSADDFAQQFNVPKAYEGYEKLMSDPEVDIVYVGAINPKHFVVAKMALNAGKHVLCEKPMCINVKESKELVDLARQKKLFLMEGIWSRCMPAYRALKKSIEDGNIGDVKQVIATFGRILKAPRLHEKQLGGGTVLDLGVYCVQFTSLAFGHVKPDKVITSGHIGPDDVDESTSTTLIYRNGGTASLVTHTKVELPCEALAIGTKGTLKLPFPMWAPTALVSESGTQEFPLPAGSKFKYNFPNGENMLYEIQHVRECLLAGKTESPLITLDESLMIAQILQDMRTQLGVTYPQD